ncbi:MAG: nucleotide exchange factor GrpE [Planctomycetota bacterium]
MNDKKKKPKDREAAVPAAAGPAPVAPAPEAPPAVTREMYEALACECGDYKDRFLRMAAEFDNYKKRAARDRDLWELGTVKRSLKDLLAVRSSIARAIAAGGAGDPAGWAAIQAQVQGILESHQVQPIEGAGRPFDPERQEAVMTVANPDVAERTVIEVVETGYAFRDTVIIPAKVIVARRPAPAADAVPEATPAADPQ